jgi:uncharacterized membrane protein
MSPLTLSHHPACRQYRHHSITVRGHKLCIGCFIGYPATLATIFALFIVWFLGFQLRFLDMIWLGIAVEAVAILGKLLLSSKRVSSKVFIKILQGIGFGLLFFAALTLQLPLLLEVLILLILWTGSNAVHGATRAYDTQKTCGLCYYKGNWSNCPGFRKTLQRLHNAGFLVD